MKDVIRIVDGLEQGCPDWPAQSGAKGQSKGQVTSHKHTDKLSQKTSKI